MLGRRNGDAHVAAAFGESSEVEATVLEVVHDDRHPASALRGEDALQHCRKVPVKLGYSVYGRVTVDSGADINIISRAFLDRLPAAERPQLEASEIGGVRGVGGQRKEVLGVVTLSMLVSYSVGSLPYESRLFSVRFHVIEVLPGGVDGLLGKEMCQPGHPFFDHIYVHHARNIEFWSDTHQPPEEVGASRTASARVQAASIIQTARAGEESPAN